MSEVLAILNIWKRSYLEEQMNHLANQTRRPDKILILQCGDHVNIADVIGKFSGVWDDIKVVRSEHDFKYFFRYALSTMLDPEYILMIDDDIMPGVQWIEGCLEKSRKYDAVICCTGRVIPRDDFFPEVVKTDGYFKDYFIGDGYDEGGINLCPEDMPVDFGCGSYFLRSEWIKYFWNIWPVTFESGEDIHLSASLMIGGGIRTIVPMQDSGETTGNLRKAYGLDENASWTRQGFFEIREKIFRYFIEEKGWAPILWGEKMHSKNMSKRKV